MYLTLNAKLGKAKKTTWQGRDYYVAPVSMMTPGVRNGSEGPLYYRPEELKRSTDVWNDVSIVVYHPTQNGKNISARSPEVLESAGVGRVYNTRYKKGWKAEAWFDVERTRDVDERVLEALENGTGMEVSTGLYADSVPVDNVEGAEYEAVNFRPDHLAVLPDQKGACSQEEGCGLLVNSRVPVATRVVEVTPGDSWNSTPVLITNSSSQESRSDPHGRSRLTLNEEYEKSYADRYAELYKQLENRYGYNVSMSEVYGTYIVFSFGGKLWKLPYSENDGECILSDEEPSKVKRVVSYEPTTNQGEPMALSKKRKADIINHLVSNCKCWQSEGDAEILANFEDDKLEQLMEAAEEETKAIAVANAAVKGFKADGVVYRFNPDTAEVEAKKESTPAKPKKETPAPVINSDPDDDDDDETPPPRRDKKTTTTTTNSEPPKGMIKKPITAEEWVRVAPVEIQNQYRYAESIIDREKAKIINQLLANVSDPDRQAHRERLMKRNLDELQYDLDMLPKAGETETPTRPVGNKSRAKKVREQQDQDVLELPTIDWNDDGTGKQTTQKKPAPTVNTDQEEYESEDDWLEHAPAHVRRKFVAANAIEAEAKKKLIDELVGNVSDPDEADELNKVLQGKSLDELKVFKKVQGRKPDPAPQGGFFGRGGIRTTGSGVNNGTTETDVLPLPKMDWAELAAENAKQNGRKR